LLGCTRKKLLAHHLPTLRAAHTRFPGLLVTLALAIAHSPQILGSKLPKSLNGHAVDSTPLHDPIMDFSRVLLEHPQTGI
jgi:hypothetical protein